MIALQAVAGVGFDWKFSEEAVGGGFLMRVMSVGVSIGGMLITALLLGIVSGNVTAAGNLGNRSHLPYIYLFIDMSATQDMEPRICKANILRCSP